MSSDDVLVGCRIVVVDDEPAQASALAALLRLEGAIATYEDVATSALAKLLVDPPDALVVDLKMPQLTGSDLLTRLRARHPGLPAVLLTGYERHDPRVEAMIGLGRVEYLAKPIELPRLVSALVRVLRSVSPPSSISGTCACFR